MRVQFPRLKPWRENLVTHKAAIVLAALTSFLAGTTVLWLVLDRQPPWWDDSFYLTKSLLMFDALMDGGVAGYLKKFFSIIPNRPPLITALPTPFYLAFGRDPRYAFGVNVLFIPVLLVSVYLIGRKFWGYRAGLIAAYIVGTMPLVYGLTRWYLVEFSLTGLVSLAIYLLIQSETLRRSRETHCFGIVCGLGLLLKVTFPLFVLFPLLYVLLRFVSSNEPGALPARSRLALRLKIVSALVVPPALLALPWYLTNFGPTMRLAEFAGFSPDADIYGTGSVFSFTAARKYMFELAGSGASYYYVLLAILLLSLVLVSGKARSYFQGFGREPLIILCLWGLPFLVFLFGRNKNLRYVAPLFPVFGLILAYTLDFTLRKLRKWQTTLICLILIFPAISLLQKSFLILGVRYPRLNHLLCVDTPLDVAREYQGASWRQKDILNALLRSARLEPGKKETVMLGTDRAYFNSDNFELAAVSGKLPLEVTTSAHTPDLGDLLRALDSSAFFIYKEGGEPEAPYYNVNRGALIQDVQRSGRFVELHDHWLLPDGGKVRIFQNLSPWWSIVKQGFIPSGIEPIQSCKVNFGGRIELTGLSIERSEGSLRVKYRWLCLQPPDREYWCFTQVLDRNGKIVGFLDHPIVGGKPPMRTWKEGDIAIEELQFPIAPSPSPKTFRLLLGLYHVASGQRLTIRSFAVPETNQASLADSDTALLVGPVSKDHSSFIKPARRAGFRRQPAL